MSDSALAKLDGAIRRELRAKGELDWPGLRLAYPAVPKSSFYHRVKANKSAIRKSVAAKKVRLANPLETTAVRRDPFLLIADFNLKAELIGINGLIERLRSAALDTQGRIKSPRAFDIALGFRLKWLKLAPDVIRNSDDTLWSDICRRFAQSVGRSTAVQFSHFRRGMLTDEEWAAFHFAVGLLRDAKEIDTGPRALPKDLQHAVRLRLQATKAILRWQIKLDEIRLIDRQVEWIFRHVGEHEELTPEVWNQLRQFGQTWMHLVGRRYGEGRGRKFIDGTNCATWLTARDYLDLPGIRVARKIVWGSSPGPNFVCPTLDPL